MKFIAYSSKLKAKKAAADFCFFILLVIGYWLLVTTLTACGPTYPKERFEDSIIKVCKNEYNLDVKVKAIGRTIAIYVPLEDLIDFTFAVSKSASEKINDVILSVSRVALSTDAKFDFYCIIAHDIRIPEIQIVIVKSVDDVKRFLLNDISRDEYSKRMLIDIRFSPQAQKERTIKDVFDRMGLDKKWQDQVINDFFRSEPTALGDIGYWNGRFFVKDVMLSEFLAEQIASRMKMEFREDGALAEKYSVKAIKGEYLYQENKGHFKLDVWIESKMAQDAAGETPLNVILNLALETTAKVIHGYKFTDFENVEITSRFGNGRIVVSGGDLELFRKKKIKLEDIISSIGS